MLHITLKRNERVFIQDEEGNKIATVTLKRQNGGQVTLGFESNPEHYLVMRERLTETNQV